MSVYIVLEQVHPPTGDMPMATAERVAADPEQFEVLGSFEAPSKRAAIKEAVKDRDPAQKNGTFVAVLVSEWKPETRRVQLTETDDWG